MKNKIERRFYEGQEIELRNEGEKHVIEGHAAVFNSLTQIWDFWETILPGAFKRTITNGNDILSLFNHDPNFVIGRSSSGTLAEIREDDTGLYYKAFPPDTTWGNDLLTSIKRRDIIGNSFGFRVIKENWRTEGDKNIRELIEVELYDIGPVTSAAYPETDVSARSNLFVRAKQKSDVDILLLSEILLRLQDGQPLTNEDRSQLNRITEQLKQIGRDPSQERHSFLIKESKRNKLQEMLIQVNER